MSIQPVDRDMETWRRCIVSDENPRPFRQAIEAGDYTQALVANR